MKATVRVTTQLCAGGMQGGWEDEYLGCWHGLIAAYLPQSWTSYVGRGT
jgi:hypothetical protein